MIRAYKTEDCERVMEVWLETSLQSHSFIDEEFWLQRFKEVENDYLPASETFVWEEKGLIKGFISILEQCYIGALFVDPAFQEQGIGSLLMQMAIDKYGALKLGVYKNNFRAVRFYRKMGFDVASQQFDAQTSEIEYIMSNVK